MRVKSSLFLLLSNGLELFPDFYHGPSVEFAVAEEGFAGCGGLIGIHIFDLGEDIHGVASVLDTLIEVVVVETWLIREEGWEAIAEKDKDAEGE